MKPSVSTGRSPALLRFLGLASLVFATVAAPRVRAQGTGQQDSSRARPTTSDTSRLRLGDVYLELERRSPRIGAANALAAAAAARVPGAGLPPDPQVQLGWMNYTIPGLAPMDPIGMTQLQVMQMLPLGGKLGLSRGIAAARAGAQTERAAEIRWEQRSQAAMAFYDLYQATQSLAVMRETLRLLQDARRTAEAMYRVGEGRQTDVLRAQVEIARMTEDTLRMVAMRAGMVARLNALLDRPADTAGATPALPAFPARPAADSLEQLANARRPMIRAGEQELSAADRMTRLARKEIIPDLTVGFQYGQRRANPGMAPTDPTMPPVAAPGTERMGSLMLGVSVPVFARSRQLKARDEAEAMRAMARAELLAMRADTRGRLGEVLASLDRARRLQQLYRGTILPQAEAAASSAFAAYRVGQVDFMTLLDNRMTVNRFRQEFVVLEAEEGKAWAELEMLTGGPLIDASSVRSAATSEDR